MKEQLSNIRYTTPSFDRRNKDPKKNYGIGSELLTFAVLGEIGAISFTVSTGKYLPQLVEELGDKLSKPMAYGISYHFYVCPDEWKDFSKPHKECSILGGKPCHCDGSSLQADELFKSMGEKINEDKIYDELEYRYFNAKEDYHFPAK